MFMTSVRPKCLPGSPASPWKLGAPSMLLFKHVVSAEALPPLSDLAAGAHVFTHSRWEDNCLGEKVSLEVSAKI